MKEKLVFIFLTSIFLVFTSYAYADDFDSFDSEFKTEKKEIFDPLEGYNRTMTSFNDYVYINVLEPTSEGYATVVPQTARVGLSNFIYNLKFPIRFLNNLLQFKITKACKELGRFTFNTAFGMFGFLDPATNRLGMNKYNEDFGQTLAFYGVGDGFPIVLPLLGPSNLRDFVGLAADGYIDPLTNTSALNYKIPDNIEKRIGITTVSAINTTSLNLGKYENLKKDAIDLYPFLRDTYAQKREKEIRE